MEITSNNKKPCLVQTSQGFSVLYKEKYLYSKYNPSREILSKINSINVLPGTLFLCCSPVLPYGLKELSEKLSENCFILACELNKDLYDFEHTSQDSSAGASASLSINNFSFLTPDESLKLPEILQEASYTLKSNITLPGAGTFKRIIRIDFSAGVSFSENLYNDVYSFSASSIMTYWKNRITLTKFGRRFSIDLFKNLSILQETTPLSSFIKKITSPIVIFGAGESLEEGIKDIKIAQDKYYILCADTALKPLVKSGIRPDGVFIEEAQSVILNAFTGALKNSNIQIFAGLSSVPLWHSLKDKSKLSYFTTVYSKSNFLDELLKTDFMPESNPPFGSVGLTLLYYALRFRKDDSVPVFIYGLDFSYKPGKTHARGTMAHLTRLLKNQRLEPVENYPASFGEANIKASGKNGENLITTPVLQSYVNLLNNYFSEYKNVFDSSSQGLKLNLEHKKPCTDENSKKTEIKKDGYDSLVAGKIITFLKEEKEALIKIRDYLCGKIKTENKDELYSTLESLLKTREYLYLHFADGHRLSMDQSFLNRIRTEIDFFLKVIK